MKYVLSLLLSGKDSTYQKWPVLSFLFSCIRCIYTHNNLSTKYAAIRNTSKKN